MSDDEPSRTLRGTMLSPGWGEGRVFVYRDLLTRFDEFYDIDDAYVEEELKRLDLALVRISDDLSMLAGRVEKEIDAQHAAACFLRRRHEALPGSCFSNVIGSKRSHPTSCRQRFWEKSLNFLPVDFPAASDRP